MAAPIEIQLRNAQSSILFMQQEHAQTLQGLHQELQKLQKKCAELNFELAMKEGTPDEEHYRKQQKVLEAEVKEAKAEKQNHEEMVEKKDRRINTMEQQLKVQEKKYVDEIKKLKQFVHRHKTERDQKSEMIAHLTAQLHQLSLTKHQHKRTVSLEEDFARTGSPQPPKEPRPSFSRHHKQVTLRHSAEHIVVNGPVRGVHTVEMTKDGGLSLRQPSYTPRSKPHSHGHSSPVSAFLVQSEPQDVDVKSGHQVLPPILPATRRHPRSTHRHPPNILAKNDGRLSGSRSKDSQSPEKHTLAVKTVFSNENNFCQVEESKSD